MRNRPRRGLPQTIHSAVVSQSLSSPSLSGQLEDLKNRAAQYRAGLPVLLRVLADLARLAACRYHPPAL